MMEPETKMPVMPGEAIMLIRTDLSMAIGVTNKPMAFSDAEWAVWEMSRRLTPETIKKFADEGRRIFMEGA